MYFDDFDFILLPLATKENLIAITKPVGGLAFARDFNSARFKAGALDVVAADYASMNYPYTITNTDNLISQYAVNLIRQSTDLNSVSWTKTSAILTPIATDFSVVDDNAYNVEVGGTPTNYQFQTSFTAVLNQPYTLVSYAKKVNFGYYYMAVYDGVAPISEVIFNLTSGSVADGTLLNGFTASITAALNGSYKCTLTFDATATSLVAKFVPMDINDISNPFPLVTDPSAIEMSSPQVHSATTSMYYAGTTDTTLFFNKQFTNVNSQNTCPCLFFAPEVSYGFTGSVTGVNLGASSVGTSPVGATKEYTIPNDGLYTLRGVTVPFRGLNSTNYILDLVVKSTFPLVKVFLGNIDSLSTAASTLDFNSFGNLSQVDFDIATAKIYTNTNGINATMHSMGNFTRILISIPLTTSAATDGCFVIACDDHSGISFGDGTGTFAIADVLGSSDTVIHGMRYYNDKAVDQFAINNLQSKYYVAANRGTIFIDVELLRGTDPLTFDFGGKFSIRAITGGFQLYDITNATLIDTFNDVKFKFAMSWDGADVVYAVNGVSDAYTYTANISIDDITSTLVKSEFYLNNLMLDSLAYKPTYLSSLTA